MLKDKFVSSLEKKYWILDTYFERYQELFPLTEVDPEFEFSRGTVAHQAEQLPIWIHKGRGKSSSYYKYMKNFTPHRQWDEISDIIWDWLERKLQEHHIEDELIPVTAWVMNGSVGSWQEMHFHGDNTLTQVIYLDSNTELTEETPRKERSFGALYALLPGDPIVYNTFIPYAGRSVIMSPQIPHGVYPNKVVPRRSIVIDYVIK